MLRKVAYNKIFRTTGMLIILGLLFLFPVSKEYSLEKVSNYKKVMKEKESIVYLLDKNNYISRVGINLSMKNKEEYAKSLVELLIIDGKYESLIPNCEPSPKSDSKRGVSTGVEMIRMSFIPASIRVYSG